MKNLKDILTTIAGFVILLSGTLLTIGEPTISLEYLGYCKIAGVAAASVIAYLTGKNPDGSTKSVEQINDQNAQAKK